MGLRCLLPKLQGWICPTSRLAAQMSRCAVCYLLIGNSWCFRRTGSTKHITGTSTPTDVPNAGRISLPLTSSVSILKSRMIPSYKSRGIRGSVLLVPHLFLSPRSPANMISQYSCFVETCERKCSTPQKRKMHLIDKHMYPKNFLFSITRDGIDGRRSLLLEGRPHQRKSSSSGQTRPSLQPSPTQRPGTIDKVVTAKTGQLATSIGEDSLVQQPDLEMDDLSSAMSSLKFVPISVRFGRGKAAGFAKR